MKFKFDAGLNYQLQAIESVARLLEGLPLGQPPLEVSLAARQGLKFNELGLANNLAIDETQLLANLQAVQQQNGLNPDAQLSEPDFSIEMETGTGKTYVYLRTILRLAQVYGLRKFIVVVPSVAIREGVNKSLELMKSHFATLFPDLYWDPYVYDSKNLNRVGDFARNNQLQLMIINIQSFIKEMPDGDPSKLSAEELKKLNVIHRQNDRMQGFRPIEYLQATRPVVIIDEPQNMESEKAKAALKSLNPCLTLRYSATHKSVSHLIYRLDPIRAYDLRLVKRIEVASIRSDDNFNQAHVRLLKTDNSKGIKAQIEIHEQLKSGEVKAKKVWVKQHDNLYDLSGCREIYRNGYQVRHIDTRPGAEYVEFTNAQRVTPDQPLGTNAQDLMRAQVLETVEQHLAKERSLKGQEIKALSLFFVDHVKSYRIYKPDGTTELGHVGRWFEEAYRQLTEGPNAPYPEAAVPDISRIHNGYFSQDRKGVAKDTTGSTRDDEDTYQLIMRDKERLLDLAEPLRFIFSHSALREGWDNPNVFQVCTLNETSSVIKKRQEIGRGLRLPVNSSGERVQDEQICRLTIIANESYEDFAKNLQQELEEDLGTQFGRVQKMAFAQIVKPAEAQAEPQPIGAEASKNVWNELFQKGYLDATGKPKDLFDPYRKDFGELFRLSLSEDLQELAPLIIDVVQSYTLKNRIVNAKQQRATVRFRKEVLLDENFKALWERVSPRTRYRVNYSTQDMIAHAAAHLKDTDLMPTIRPLSITATLVQVDVTKAGISADRRLAVKGYDLPETAQLPDLLVHLQNETHLTRDTLRQILVQSGRLDEFFLNPQQFMLNAARTINHALGRITLKGLEYAKIPDFCWDVKQIEEDGEKEITRYLQNLHEVQNQHKTFLSHVDCDSETEKKFARDLDANERVACFFKLPRWFKIDTPIGPYNPDWAFVTQGEAKLYFVRETKSTLLAHERRQEENDKIDCGRKHFAALDVDFDIATDLRDVDISGKGRGPEKR